MKTVEQLLASHCREVKGTAMSDADVGAQLSVLDHWVVDGGALTKDLSLQGLLRNARIR